MKCGHTSKQASRQFMFARLFSTRKRTNEKDFIFYWSLSLLKFKRGSIHRSQSLWLELDRVRTFCARVRSSSNFVCSGSIKFELSMFGFDRVRTSYVWVRSSSNFPCLGSIGFELSKLGLDRVRTSYVWVRSSSNPRVRVRVQSNFELESKLRVEFHFIELKQFEFGPCLRVAHKELRC